MISNDDIRREFIAAGFTIKDGCDDLKPYVYEAARRVLALASAEVARAVAAERERLAEVVRDMYREAKAELQDEDQNTWYDGYCEGLEAASNRLRADPQRLQDKGE